MGVIDGRMNLKQFEKRIKRKTFLKVDVDVHKAIFQPEYLDVSRDQPAQVKDSYLGWGELSLVFEVSTFQS
jgi:hypothetical protein